MTTGTARLELARRALCALRRGGFIGCYAAAPPRFRCSADRSAPAHLSRSPRAADQRGPAACGSRAGPTPRGRRGRRLLALTVRQRAGAAAPPPTRRRNPRTTGPGRAAPPGSPPAPAAPTWVRPPPTRVTAPAPTWVGVAGSGSQPQPGWPPPHRSSGRRPTWPAGLTCRPTWPRRPSRRTSLASPLAAPALLLRT